MNRWNNPHARMEIPMTRVPRFLGIFICLLAMLTLTLTIYVWCANEPLPEMPRIEKPPSLPNVTATIQQAVDDATRKVMPKQ